MQSNRLGAAIGGAIFLLTVSACGVLPSTQNQVERGRYLTSVAGCGDCHTPGYFLGKTDESKHLNGGDVSFFIPGMGYFYPPNLTPDEATGLGKWSEAQIVTALRTGVRPDGRQLAPIMPTSDYANLTLNDAKAIAVYLKSLTPVNHKVPDPTATDQTPPGPSMAVVAPPALTPLGLPPAISQPSAPAPSTTDTGK
jgi:mono/diheme cytochrome c family protein